MEIGFIIMGVIGVAILSFYVGRQDGMISGIASQKSQFHDYWNGYRKGMVKGYNLAREHVGTGIPLLDNIDCIFKDNI